MNIRDIARISGYSVGTVSRVLNGHPNVSEQARQRVLEVVEECGYEPNSNARHLKRQTLAAVAVFVKGARNMLFADILEQIQALLQKAGEEARVTYLDEDANEVVEAVRFQNTMHPRGILFLGGNPAFFEERFGAISVPAVLLTNTSAGLGFDNLASVSTDDAAAAAQVVEYLIECGHRRIGIVGGNRVPGQISARRLRGAQEAMARHGVAFDLERDYEPCRYSMEDGYDAAVRLLLRASDLTALFALSDVIALGAMRAVRDAGLSIPGDLSVAGFDGIELSQFYTPRLTTIRQDTKSIACIGVKELLRLMGDPSAVAGHETVPFQLFKRESVRVLDA